MKIRHLYIIFLILELVLTGVLVVLAIQLNHQLLFVRETCRPPRSSARSAGNLPLQSGGGMCQT